MQPLGLSALYRAMCRRMAKPLQLGLVTVSAVTTVAHAGDEWFNDAYRANQQNDTASLAQFQAAMQDGVLAYYPEYWLLNSDLALQPAQSIIQFNQKYPQSAMAEKLTADYVEANVAAGAYSQAAKVLPYVTNPDQAESCAVAQVQASSGDGVVLAALKDDVWLTTDKQPDSCNGLVRFMLDSPIFTAQDKEQRLFAMLRAGKTAQAVSTAGRLNIALSFDQLASIARDPQSYLWTAPKATVQDQLYLIYALGRLADSDLDAAINMVDGVAQNTPSNIQKYLYRTVAYIGGTTVLKNNFKAIIPQLFDKSYGYPFSPEEAEIYARQSIRFSHWEGIIRAVNSMPTKQQQEDRWQYWLARAVAKRGDRQSLQTAQSIYQRLAKSGDYHGLLAKQQLNDSSIALMADDQAQRQDFNRLDKNIHFRRAFALKNVDAPSDYTNREWNWAVRQAYLQHDDGLILAAAQKAQSMGWYDRAIYAVERTEKKSNERILYPMPYQQQVVYSSQSAGINPAWAYGIMRQESRFVTNARSHVGAGGLMQIMPSTAQTIARKLGETYSAQALHDLNTNIRYGTYYLGSIQSQLSGHPALATAGYNAGPNRAKAWQPNFQYLDVDQYIESIPFNETRNYVKAVMTNTAHYGTLLGQGNNQAIRSFLAPIPPKN